LAFSGVAEFRVNVPEQNGVSTFGTRLFRVGQKFDRARQIVLSGAGATFSGERVMIIRQILQRFVVNFFGFRIFAGFPKLVANLHETPALRFFIGGGKRYGRRA
jgi:hypothetical protein